MYRLKITSDEDGGFEYSPPFKLRVPGSMFKKGSVVKAEANFTTPVLPEGGLNSEKGVEWRS